jgi:hypothetical protein
MWILVVFNAYPNPDPESKTNADACGSGSALKVRKFEFLHEKYT